MESIRILRPKTLVLGGIALTTVGVAAAAASFVPTPTSVIHACFDSTNGALRLVGDGDDCRNHERAISWNVSGPNGAQGPTGPQGPTGDTGSKGDKGDTGETGAQGPTGPQGANGAPGATGAQGADGAIGPKGDKGDTGETGAQGANGAPGATGAQGANGSPGATGPRGLTGDEGDPGPTGPAGPPGGIPEPPHYDGTFVVQLDDDTLPGTTSNLDGCRPNRSSGPPISPCTFDIPLTRRLAQSLESSFQDPELFDFVRIVPTLASQSDLGLELRRAFFTGIALRKIDLTNTDPHAPSIVATVSLAANDFSWVTGHGQQVNAHGEEIIPMDVDVAVTNLPSDLVEALEGAEGIEGIGFVAEPFRVNQQVGWRQGLATPIGVAVWTLDGGVLGTGGQGPNAQRSLHDWFLPSGALDQGTLTVTIQGNGSVVNGATIRPASLDPVPLPGGKIQLTTTVVP